jgi:hypothetical protein
MQILETVREEHQFHKRCSTHDFNNKEMKTGRGISETLDQIFFFVNRSIYAKLGCINRQERETLWNTDIINLLRHLPHSYIIGGDFNCVFARADCTCKVL